MPHLQDGPHDTPTQDTLRAHRRAVAPMVCAGLFAWLLLGERPTACTVLFIGLALTGILIMFGGEAGGGRWSGNLIDLSVPLAAGLNFVLMRKSGARIDLVPAVLVGGPLSAPARAAT